MTDLVSFVIARDAMHEQQCKGSFGVADPAPRLGQEPELMPGPASADGGIEGGAPAATGTAA